MNAARLPLRTRRTLLVHRLLLAGPKRRVAELLRAALRDPAAVAGLGARARPVPTAPQITTGTPEGTVRLLTAPRASAWHREWALALARELTARGVPAVVGWDAPGLQGPERRVHIAPHLPGSFPADGRAAGDGAGLLLNTEALDSPAFSEALALLQTLGDEPFLQTGHATAATLRALGWNAWPCLPRGLDPEADVPWPAEILPPPTPAPTVWGDRPYAVHAQGLLAPQRGRRFARIAKELARWPSLLLLQRRETGSLGGGPEAAASGTRALRYAKVVLCLRASAGSRRVDEALAWRALDAGCLVLTEPGAPLAPCVPGRHVLEAPLDRMPKVLRWVLETPNGQTEAARILERARELFLSSDDATAASLVGILQGAVPRV